MADIKISELTQAESLSLSDLMESAVPYNGGFLSRRMSIAQLANYLENYVQHTALSTGAKSIIGAINEIVGDLDDYYTKSETYSKTKIDELIAGVSGLHFLVVQTLPVSDIDPNTIYLVPKQDVGTQDIYDEFIYIVEEAPTPSHWEKIGTTEIDLSDYVTDTELETILNDYVTTSGLNTILASYATTSAMTTALADKVDKVSGKGLSTEDYTTSEKMKLNGIESGAQVNTVTGVKGNDENTYRTGNVNITKDNIGLGNVPNVATNNQTPTFSEASTRANISSGEKLSVIMGKIKKFFSDLKTVAFTGSYNDLTDKPSIPSGQVQSDWSQTNTSEVDYIKNKPQNLVSDASYVHTDNNYTTTEKNKLSGIAEGAEVNVQSDWSITNTSSDAFIKNKPSIPTALSDLSDDATHRVVTDTQITTWNNKSGSDVNVTQTLVSTNKNYPLLFSTRETSDTTADRTGTAQRNNSVFVNPSTGKMTNGGNIETIKRVDSSTQDNPAELLLTSVYNDGSDKSSFAYFRAYTAKVTSGVNLVIGSGGNTFIGSGEAANGHYNVNTGTAEAPVYPYRYSTTEKMFITSDNDLHLQSTGQTIANRKGILITSNHSIVPDVADNATNNAGSIGTSTYKWANIYATNLNGVAIGDSPEFTDTTYTFTGGTNKFSVSVNGGTPTDVTITPSISNNITGSGTRTNGYLAKFSDTNTITNGPQIGSDTTKFLRNDGSWVVPYELPLATSSIRGGVKIGYTQSGKNYPVQLSSEKMYVNVPWTDTDYRKGFYGTTDTVAGTATKVVTLSNTDGWELKAGVIVGVYFSATNTAGSVKLNVNGSGAISISYTGNTAYTGTNANISGRASHTTYYMYNGTYWVFFNCTYNYQNSTYTINNKTITLQQNGTDVDSFTLNQSTDQTINFTDNKVTQSDASSTGWRNLALVRNNKTSYTEGVVKTMGLTMQVQTIGVANTEGRVNLAIGNSTAKTAADNYTGYLYMYNGNGARDTIQTNSSQTGNITLTLPNSTGTFALVSDISTAISTALTWKWGNSITTSSAVLCDALHEVHITFSSSLNVKAAFNSPVDTLAGSDSNSAQYTLYFNNNSYITFRVWTASNKVYGKVTSYVINGSQEPFLSEEVYYR